MNPPLAMYSQHMPTLFDTSQLQMSFSTIGLWHAFISFLSFHSALPVFSQDPVNVIAILSTTVLLPCLVQDHNSFTYAWSFEGQAVPLSLPGYDLLNNGSLLIQSVETSHDGNYVCSVNNSVVIVTGNVFLKVQGNFTHMRTCLGMCASLRQC